MTMHDSKDSLLDAMAKGVSDGSDEEVCSKCRRKPTDYSDFRGWDLNLATDESFCPDCMRER
jgi:hypothetical protein